jgi:formylglycine-generating enzyme required for sulfatase activity
MARWISVLFLAVLSMAGTGFADGEFVSSSTGMKMVRIESGAFEMGQAEGGDYDERQVHTVEITQPFYMAATEVTNAQYEKFRPGHRKTSSKPDELSNGDDEAVIFVSWRDAVDFCKWLSDTEGKPYRLPTEAEWEYACRAGTTTLYNTGDELPQSYQKNQEIITGPEKASLVVGQNPPNAWGLHDMHGNVEEWCLDWYGPYVPGKQIDPVGRVISEFRVSRGGSHSTLVKHLRSANRMAALPADKHWLLGFRVVMGARPKTKALAAVGPKLCVSNVAQKRYDWKAKVDMDKPYFKDPIRFVRKVDHPERIPMYSHNHLPCITWCDNGDLLTTWFSVTSKKVDKNSNGERGREMTILASRLRLGKEQWDVPSEFYKVPDRNMTGSALVNDHRGMLHYFNGVSVAENWNVNNILIAKTSEDNGATWSATRILNPDRGAKPSQPIDSAYCADDGRLIVPTDWSDTGMKGGATGIWISEDRGKSWMVTERPIEGIHAAVVDFGKGKFMALGRSKAKKTMPKSVTVDNGKSWRYSLTDLPGIGGGKRCVLRRLNEGPLLLVSFTKRKRKKNPNAGMKIIDAAGKERTVYGMYAALSFDDGRTWPVRKLVTAGGSARQFDGGAWTRKFTMDDNNAEPMGYLAGIQTPDGIFHLISSALHYQFNFAWLKEPMPTAANP